MSYRRSKYKTDCKIVGFYDLGETIGKGHYAVVKRAKHCLSGEKVAVKVIDKTKLDSVSKAHLFQEVTCMKLVQHPNVVRLYEVIETQTTLYLVQELGDGGDLYDCITKHECGLDEENAKHYFSQIVEAIGYCHQLHVVHRDLKLENVVLFEKSKTVKITDFGFSNKFIPGRMLDTSCGSLAYSAPEILLGDSYDAPAVDIWSLGVILYMLVCGKPPFHEANDSETLIKIMDCQYTVPSHCSSSCRQLISDMLLREPTSRITLDNIIEHEWLKGCSLNHVPQQPLFTRERLSTDEHCFIMQHIVDGKVASRDEILQSLESNAYNHITATYYLLAEKLLRERTRKASGDQSAAGLSPQSLIIPRVPSLERHPLDIDSQKEETVTSPQSPFSPATRLAMSLPIQSQALLPGKRCSLIQEELTEEDEENSMDVDVAAVHSAEDLNEQCKGVLCNGSIESADTKASMSRSSPSTTRSLYSIHSSPQLLKQICEEDEGGMGRGHHRLKKQELPQNASHLPDVPAVNRVENVHRKRFTLGRGTSHSSSEASDTDDVVVSTSSRHKRKEKNRHSLSRHDSSEQLSDADGSIHSRSSRKSDRLSREHSHEKPSHEKTRRFSQEEKRRPSLGEEKRGSDLLRSARKATIAGTVKKSVSLILGRTCAVGDATTGVMFKNNTWSSCTDLSPPKNKLSTTGSITTRYLLDRHHLFGCSFAKELRISRCEVLKELEASNQENRSHSLVIHIRSKDFNSLVDKFSGISDSEHDKSLESSGSNLRQRTTQVNKIDINRNALSSQNPSSTKDSNAKEGNFKKSKCCSVV